MLAAEHDLFVEQGATFELTLDIVGTDSRLFELATTTTAKMHVRRRLADETTLIELTTENGRIQIDPVAGTLTLGISAADTASLTSGGVYDLKIISALGAVDRVLQGNFVLEKETTR